MRLNKKLVSLISFIITIILSSGYVTFKHINLNDLLPKSVPTVSKSTKTDSSGYPEWSYDLYPDYYAENGKAVIDESKFPEKGNINYTGKDKLGRTLAAYGTITLQMVYDASSKGRPDFAKNDKPSGLNENPKVKVETSTGTYDGWFWNRSHLIAHRLGGETTSNNAITGTRMQNVGNRSNTGGMYYIEELAVKYLTENRKEYLYYSAEPIYNGDELIPRYVIVNVKSSDGKFDKQIITFNNQKGYTINYNDGTFTKDE